MSALRSTDDLGISSDGLRKMGAGDLVIERALDPVSRSRSGSDREDGTLFQARIIQILNSQKTELDGDYRFERLPVPNDQITVLNRRGSYDILRVLYATREPETTVYVRWVAHR